MATQLVVLASNGRRATVKTQANQALTDVLQAACATLRLNPDQYTLKHKSKPLDLSLTVRLANLPNHAQLELIQASRSPSVVSVALQLPPSDGSVRLTDKFPSTTTLWQILRSFESGAAGSGPSNQPSRNLNFTQRSTPQVNDGAASGSGRLFYEMPVVHIMGRDFASFTDLQKTLAQLGLNGGSALIRLHFRATDQPLEEAMATISQYFDAQEDCVEPRSDAHGAHSHNVGGERSVPVAEEAGATQDVAGDVNPAEPVPMEQTLNTSEDSKEDATMANTELLPTSDQTQSDKLPGNITVGPDQRPISIFAPPSSDTPQAATVPFNPADYETTIESARLHQARLAESSRNKRLPSDKELAEQENAKSTRLASIREVTVRVRLPDQTQVQGTFNNLDTTGNLYKFVRDVLRAQDQQFTLRYTGPKGQQVSMKDGTERLVGDLQLRGRVLVNFVWAETVDVQIRNQPALKQEFQRQAQPIKVDLPEDNLASEAIAANIPDSEGTSAKEPTSGQDKETKLKKFLGRLSKK